MTILNDWEISQKALKGMISPFIPQLISHVPSNFPSLELQKMISYGLSSFGYDVRLSPKEFKVFTTGSDGVVDPKNFNPRNLKSIELQKDRNGSFFILPAHSYGLGVTLEKLDIPDDVTGVCFGKSTYARCGIVIPSIPISAGWKGYLTLEFSNSSSTNCRLYANEGVMQLLFFQGNECETSYNDRKGKYQEQEGKIVLAKV